MRVSTVRVSKPHGGVDVWEAVSDERDWLGYTHQVHEGELIVYIHSFRRIRERVDGVYDRLMWRHHATKVAHRYRPHDWDEVVATPSSPPYGFELVPRRAARL